MRAELQNALSTEGPLVIAGSTPGWAAWLAAKLAADELVIMVGPDDDYARRLETDVRFLIGAHDPTLLDPIAVLPGIDIEPYAELSPDRDAIVERLATLYRLAVPELRPRVVLTSAAALVRKTMPAPELASRGRVIKVGDRIDRDELAAQLIAAGWSKLPVTDEPGTFAVRGGVIDIFAPLSPHPIRIELFGDDVETLRWFDAESQRTLRPIDQVILHPVRETIATGNRDVRTRVRDYADEIAFPTKAARRLIEQLEAGEVFVGIEGLTPAFHDTLVAPATYVPPGARWMFLDPAACRRTVVEAWADAEARFPDRKVKTLHYPPSAHYATDAELGFAAPRRIELPVLDVLDTQAQKLRVTIDDLHGLTQQLDHARTFGDTEHAGPLIETLTKWLGRGMRVAIASDSQSRSDRLFGVLNGRGLAVRLAAPGEKPVEQLGVTIVTGAPAHGFAAPEDGVAVITAANIFGQRVHHVTGKRKRARDALLGSVGDFSQLSPGDYLVHQRHGVGRYIELAKLDVVGAAGIETLKLEYDGGTLYLPVYRLGEVQRYVGAEGHAPKLDKLGGVTWEITRNKVERHVQALAEELLQLYAQRASLPGHRFPAADDSYRELEATFPFDETPDQLAAIESVLADMEAPRAMDRLVCGDVGYGKTEVALRAVFRAVQGGSGIL